MPETDCLEPNNQPSQDTVGEKGESSLSLEILKLVQQAEDQGMKIRNQAQQEAREVTKGSEMAIAQQEKQAAIDHRNLFNQLLEERKHQVQSAIDRQVPEYGRKHREAFEEAQSKMDDGVQLIVERIMDHGNC